MLDLLPVILFSDGLIAVDNFSRDFLRVPWAQISTHLDRQHATLSRVVIQNIHIKNNALTRRLLTPRLDPSRFVSMSRCTSATGCAINDSNKKT